MCSTLGQGAYPKRALLIFKFHNSALDGYLVFKTMFIQQLTQLNQKLLTASSSYNKTIAKIRA